MTTVIACECYADEDVLVVIREVCGLPLRPRHSASQGNVINDLLVRCVAELGIKVTACRPPRRF